MLFSGVYILSVRGIRQPMVYLSLERFLATFLFVLNLLQTAHTPIYGKALWNPLHVVMLLTFFPFLFAYVTGMVRPGRPYVRFWLFNFLPVAVLAMLYFSFEALFGKMPLVSNYADLRHNLNMPQLWVLFVAAGISVAMISVHTVQAIGRLRKHRRNLESNFSYIEGSTLDWMWWVIAITLLKWLIFFLLVTTEARIAVFAGLFLFTVEPVIITVLVLRQKDLYRMPANGKNFIPEHEDEDSELLSNKRKELKRNLLALLKKDEIFKDPELSNEKVREMLGTNRTYLWQVINQDMNTTVYQLINTYRINKSVEMMRDPLHRKMPLHHIAQICGFRSLSAFSVFFKQTYGKTPTEWRNEVFQGKNNTE
jgi:AraC-like DNA-binding protein